jgi:esterase/lipase superfamily enzyme
MVMRRDHVAVQAPAIGGDGDLIAYGHWGRPVLVFPSQQGRAWDYEDRGMISSIAHLLDGGKAKVYCVDSFDSGSWYRDDIPLEERAVLHGDTRIGS